MPSAKSQPVKKFLPEYSLWSLKVAASAGEQVSRRAQVTDIAECMAQQDEERA